uniref:ORFY protein n=1 Tax=Cacao swollen shoot virus TaxID=31559 RepID=A0A6G8IUH8_9VIRU|nr:ORFY protein [Cacao swollen shoot virus]
MESGDSASSSASPSVFCRYRENNDLYDRELRSRGISYLEEKRHQQTNKELEEEARSKLLHALDEYTEIQRFKAVWIQRYATRDNYWGDILPVVTDQAKAVERDGNRLKATLSNEVKFI